MHTIFHKRIVVDQLLCLERRMRQLNIRNFGYYILSFFDDVCMIVHTLPWKRNHRHRQHIRSNDKPLYKTERQRLKVVKLKIQKKLKETDSHQKSGEIK